MHHLVPILKIFFKFISPILLIITYILKTSVYEDVIYFEYAYIILLSSMVGYFTNFIAIKMLFRPKNKTVFNRQGLIPRNQKKIALNLGHGISSNFFDPDDLLNYISEKNLIENIIFDAKLTISKKISDPEVQQRITSRIITLFDQNSHKIEHYLKTVSEKNFAKFLSEIIDVQTIVSFITEYIEKNIQSGEIDLRKLSQRISAYLEKNVPKIANIIYKQIQHYIDSQDFFKKATLNFIAWISDFDQKKVEQKIYQLTSSKEFRSEVYRQLEKGLNGFVEYLQSDKGNTFINNHYKKFIHELEQIVKLKAIPLIIHKLRHYLEQRKTWEKLESQLYKILDFIEIEFNRIINSNRFHQSLRQFMPGILEKLDIPNLITQKVESYDTDQLEKLILDATGEHLGAIEVLGGILGGLTGIAIFNPQLFLLVLGGIALVFLIEKAIDSAKEMRIKVVSK